MRVIERKRVTVDRIAAVVCDRCQKRVEAGDHEHGYDEFETFSGNGGYASTVWGDGVRWWVDLCEKCQGELFFDIANIQD